MRKSFFGASQRRSHFLSCATLWPKMITTSERSAISFLTITARDSLRNGQDARGFGIPRRLNSRRRLGVTASGLVEGSLTSCCSFRV